MKKILIATAAVLLLSGCGHQVRYRTAGLWTNSQEGKPVLYQTYLEGTCSNGFLGFGKSCSNTNSKLKRCTLNPDNTLVCVEDAEANKILNKDE